MEHLDVRFTMRMDHLAKLRSETRLKDLRQASRAKTGETNPHTPPKQ
jgi:hypothetical protein